MGAQRRITSLQRQFARDLYETNPDLTLAGIAASASMSLRSVCRLASEGGWARARHHTAGSRAAGSSAGGSPTDGSSAVGAPAPPDDGAASPPAWQPPSRERPDRQRIDSRAGLVDELWRAVTRHVLDLGAAESGGAAGAAGTEAAGSGADAADGRQPAGRGVGRRNGSGRERPGRNGSGRDGQSASALMMVARTIEKLTEMDRAARDTGAPPDEGPEDIDEFRAEIARRLESLHGRRDG